MVGASNIVGVGVVVKSNTINNGNNGGANGTTITKVGYVAEPDQTIFVLPNNDTPDEILQVFEQQTLLIPGLDYAYNAGVLTLTNEALEGTFIQVFYQL